MKSKILTLVAIAVATLSGPAWATTIFSDDFSTFAHGNLAGQHGWFQPVGSTTLPLQVSGGNVVIPDNQTADNQDVAKNLRIYSDEHDLCGYVAQLFERTWRRGLHRTSLRFWRASGGFANARLTAIDNSANVPGTYLLEARYTGQAGNPFVAGARRCLWSNLQRR